MDTVINTVGGYLVNSNPILETVFAVLGSLIVIMSVLDAIIPDEIDHGFFKKLQEIAVISSIMNFLMRFSLLRNKKEGE
jgi:hypothetical protein